ncbi:MAG: DNA polymerase III subunit delta' [Acidobacteriota bacterium]|nr:DNA polymerase III subunit delta' [Acidobacteriota bacterium]
MGFATFHGNAETVTRLREMIERGRLPHAVILAGPRGAGKYTLAQMAAKAMNCLERPDNAGLADFCGRCSNCVRIAQADDLDARFTEAVEAREGLKDADKKDTRVFVQTHPDVLVIPPDPPQMMIKVGQVRHVIENIYFKPQEGRERVFIFTSTAFIREAENSLLKVLEEPPDFATIFLLAENPGELLPTIRSRCVTLTLGALPVAEIEAFLSQHPETQHSGAQRTDFSAQQRALVARLAQGAIGRARNFDLAGYIASRTDALALLRSAIGGDDHSALFRVTETYRAGAEGKGKTDQLLRALYLLLEDLMFAKSGTTELIRNTDIAADLARMAQPVSFDWIAGAAHGLTEVERGMRRNLLRSLSLDAFAVSLER